MKLKTIITILLALIALTGQAQAIPQDWFKADSIVKLLGIPFPQIYESTPMSTYGVTSIPHTILFAPDGTILARGLRGEDIEKKLTEVFSNKK